MNAVIGFVARGNHLVAQNDEKDRPLPADAEKRALVRDILQRRAAEQSAIDAHHAAERAAGFDACHPI